MSNEGRSVLYIGVTSDLRKRVIQHKEGYGSIFTSKYRCYFLVYYEHLVSIEEAIRRETLLKRWDRQWKNELIATINPELNDLFEEL